MSCPRAPSEASSDVGEWKHLEINRGGSAGESSPRGGCEVTRAESERFARPLLSFTNRRGTKREHAEGLHLCLKRDSPPRLRGKHLPICPPGSFPTKCQCLRKVPRASIKFLVLLAMMYEEIILTERSARTRRGKPAKRAEHLWFANANSCLPSRPQENEDR